MKTIVLSIAAMALASCAGGSYDRHDHTTAGVWGRNTATNADARNVQVIVARQAKEAKCKGEVSERQGRDGTAPRDYKCKRFQG